ncbi:MAG: hypothetical protein JSW11_05115 [Candidatus Heimdallarchaeota archaeon]|nr:MAG: hypothetical protein JSW11_05115 [Candidatus Heimdallarchaeota archaeon]
MDIEKLREASLRISEAIFTKQHGVEIEGLFYPIHRTKSGLRNVTYSDIWFIEQNPQKDSRHAKLAQEGHQILWGLKKRTYVLRVIDGKFTLLKKIP